MKKESIFLILLLSFTLWAEEGKLPALPQTGVSIPWSDFKGLLEKLLVIKPAPPPEKPPYQYAISSVFYQGEVAKETCVIRARVELEVFERSWVKIPLWRSEVVLKGAILNGKKKGLKKEAGRWYILVKGKGTYNITTSFWLKVSERGGLRKLYIPLLENTSGEVSLSIPGRKIDITLSPKCVFEKEVRGERSIVKFSPPSVSNILIEWSKALPKPKKQKPKLYAETNSLFSIGEEVIKCSAIINYSILYSEIEIFKLTFPPEVNIIQVSGEGIREWRTRPADKFQLLVIELKYGMLGSYSLHINYEKPLGSSSSLTSAPIFRVQGVEREKGFIGVCALSNVEVKLAETEGIILLDIKELPSALWQRATSPILIAFKYTRHPYRVAFEITSHEILPVVEACIDSAHIVTLFTKHGKAVTNAVYKVRNNIRQFLKLTLPPRSTIWSAFVSNQPVKPAQDKKGATLIPLKKSPIAGTRLVTFDVEVVYLTETPGWSNFSGTRVALTPKVDLEIGQLVWSVYLPREYFYPKFWSDLAQISDREVIISGERKAPRVSFKRKLLEKALMKDEIRERHSKGFYFNIEQQKLLEEKTYQAFVEPQRRRAVAEKEELPLEEVQAEAALGAGALPIKIVIPTEGILQRFTKLVVIQEANKLKYIYINRSVKRLIFWLLFLALLGLSISFVVKRRVLRKFKKTTLRAHQELKAGLSVILLSGVSIWLLKLPLTVIFTPLAFVFILWLIFELLTAVKWQELTRAFTSIQVEKINLERLIFRLVILLIIAGVFILGVVRGEGLIIGLGLLLGLIYGLALGVSALITAIKRRKTAKVTEGS